MFDCVLIVLERYFCGKMDEQEQIFINKQNERSSTNVTPFSINDILSRRAVDEDEDLQEKALDMTKSPKHSSGEFFNL